MRDDSDEDLHIVGWQEWVHMPSLGVDAIKAKIDTGAKTCALHAFYIEPFTQNGEDWVRFGLHPHQDDFDTELECTAPLADRRTVTDSGGHSELRYVIRTTLVLDQVEFEAEITLTNRDTMRFRMLIGRNALNHRFLVNPAKSFALGLEPGQRTIDEEGSDNEDCHPVKK